MKVSIKEVKKGDRVRLANGWEADVMDNTVNQQTRVCRVYGFETEMGSVYSTDIAYVRRAVFNDTERYQAWMTVEHTPSQIKAKAARSAMGW